MINKKKKYTGILITMLVFSIFCSLISGLGLSSDYNKDSPFIIGPGEVKNVVFGRLQNLGEQSLNLELELIEGQEIASLTTNGIIAEPGSTNTPINLRIAIPKEAAEGTKYSVTLIIKETSSQAKGGMVTFVESQRSTMTVLVQKPIEIAKEEKKLWIWLFLLGIIIVALVIVIYLFFKQRRISAKKIK